jgi:hypothetical protein
MPCSFGPLWLPRSGACSPLSGYLRVTVTVRWIPLVTAAYGTWVARPARTTRLAAGGDGSQLGRRVRPFLGDHGFVGKRPWACASSYPPLGVPHFRPQGPGGEGVTSFPRTVVGAWLGAVGCVLLPGREVVLVEHVSDGNRAVRAAQLLPHRFG